MEFMPLNSKGVQWFKFGGLCTWNFVSAELFQAFSSKWEMTNAISLTSRNLCTPALSNLPVLFFYFPRKEVDCFYKKG